MNFTLKKHLKTILYPLLGLLVGCTSIGPNQIDIDRPRYNDIVHKTNLEQALKNIVRLRYVQAPSYFQVSSVISSYSMVKSLNATNNQMNSYDFVPEWAISPGVAYSDNPTISYTPVAGSNFIVSLENPVNFDYFILLSHGGNYDVESLSKLMLAKIGPITNSQSATHLSTDDEPEYLEYYEMIEQLGKILQTKEAQAFTVFFNHQRGIMLSFKHPQAPKNLALKKILHVPAHSKNIIFLAKNQPVHLEEQNGSLVTVAKPLPANVIPIRTRSINGMLLFLAHGVQVPEEDLKAHVTSEVYDKNGKPFDWTPIMHDVMTIHSSKYKPSLTQRVLVETYHNGYWFYIKDSDINSKESLLMVLALMELAAAIPTQASAAPALTLSAGA